MNVFGGWLDGRLDRAKPHEPGAADGGPGQAEQLDLLQRLLELLGLHVGLHELAREQPQRGAGGFAVKCESYTDFVGFEQINLRWVVCPGARPCRRGRRPSPDPGVSAGAVPRP